MVTNKPKNPNYSAVVCRIKSIIPLENCDNVVATNLFGYQAIVGKDTKIGDIGLFFPAETQLSEEYCRENNLFRHKEKNKDQTKGGYIEDNRRVKAVKFRGHKSNCLFMPLDSLGYIKGTHGQRFDEGVTFDEIDGNPICKKYEVYRKTQGAPSLQQKREKRYDEKFIPEHIDTENYWRNIDKIHRDAEVIVTQKLHGTSIRVGNSKVKRKLTLKDRVARKLGVSVKEHEYDNLYCSKKVVKDANNPNQKHYYDEDVWTTEGKKLDDLVPKGYIVYGELVGYTPSGKPIQVGYTYNYPKGICGLYVYRVAHINEDGLMADLSWDQVKQFCKERGLNHVTELWRGRHSDFDADAYMDVRFSEIGYDGVLTLPEGTVDEGVCVRVEGIVPMVFKAKSPAFLEHETKLLDKKVTDMETNQEAT